ncbi:MAG: hypothetical protein CBARDCOR_2785 [uncultured Caballeronia sp.]|nr:MAG: hypothetical protein CBARDCOR_2785 [uncultured Caballeronia sp.]
MAEEKPTLKVSRPEKNVIAITIGGVSVALSPEGVSDLIEQLSNTRASMDVEQPGDLPPGWRFVATKNPVMATQRYANGVTVCWCCAIPDTAGCRSRSHPTW